MSNTKSTWIPSPSMTQVPGITLVSLVLWAFLKKRCMLVGYHFVLLMYQEIISIKGVACSSTPNTTRFDLAIATATSCVPSIDHQALIEPGSTLITSSRGLVEAAIVVIFNETLTHVVASNLIVFTFGSDSAFVFLRKGTSRPSSTIMTIHSAYMFALWLVVDIAQSCVHNWLRIR
jgi:hypothetical protein